MALPLSERSALLRNLLLFGRVLRSLGLRTSSGQLADVAQSLQYIDLASREDFKQATSCNLVSRQEEIELFGRAFDAFWQRTRHSPEMSGPLAGREDLSTEMKAQPGGLGETTQERERSRSFTRPHQAFSEDAVEGLGLSTFRRDYSRQEALRTKDFALLSSEELEDAKRFLESMKWTMDYRRSRRMTSSKRGIALDMRGSIRKNLRYGGELIRLARRAPKLRPRQLVVLCDISGSMDRYSRLLLHLLHSLASRGGRMEVFLFGTRLTRVTHTLRTRDADTAIASASRAVKDWAGGTRIGESLRDFNRQWARRVLGNGATVLIISDGWDRGNTAMLSAEMKRLQRASFRLIWLNPLLGSSEYRPVTQGIRAVLPYVDDFLPIHSMSCLQDLALLLNDLQAGKSERRQGKSHNNSNLISRDS